MANQIAAHIIILWYMSIKKKNPDRPISLLTTLPRIFEKVIQSRLQDYWNSADTVTKFKFGFRSNYSTV